MERVLILASFVALALGCMPERDLSTRESSGAEPTESSDVAPSRDEATAIISTDEPGPGAGGVSFGPGAAFPQSRNAEPSPDRSSALPAIAKPTSADPVSAKADVHPPAVAPGGVVEFQVAISIADGWHIYGESPGTGPYLPTRLSLRAPDAFVDEGPGKSSPAVVVPTPQGPGYEYRDNAILIRELRVPDTVEPGIYAIDATLEYQACDASRCLPHKSLPLSATLEVTSPRRSPSLAP